MTIKQGRETQRPGQVVENNNCVGYENLPLSLHCIYFTMLTERKIERDSRIAWNKEVLYYREAMITWPRTWHFLHYINIHRYIICLIKGKTNLYGLLSVLYTRS